MPRPKVYDDALRTRLLDRAGELLSAEGIGALSLRRLAADADTSTTAVYSLFGGKPGLVRELYVEGFRRFAERLAAVALSGDHGEDLVRLGLAYRESALADPNLYAVTFTRALSEDGERAEGQDEITAQARAALRPVLEVIQAAVRDGVFLDEPVEVIGVASWAVVHGLVSLELNGNVPERFDVAADYERVLRASVRGWLR